MNKIRTIKGGANLQGIVEVPGDKSISHRSIIIPAISTGVCEISNILKSEDVKHTLNAFKAMGVKVEESKLENLISHQLCNVDQNSNVNLTSKGRILIQEMGLTPKPMKRIKITGNEASDVIDKMFDELQ